MAESVIMHITGHSTREMFDRYNKVNEDDNRIAIDQMRLFVRKEPKQLMDSQISHN